MASGPNLGRNAQGGQRQRDRYRMYANTKFHTAIGRQLVFCGDVGSHSAPSTSKCGLLRGQEAVHLPADSEGPCNRQNRAITITRQG